MGSLEGEAASKYLRSAVTAELRPVAEADPREILPDSTSAIRNHLFGRAKSKKLKAERLHMWCYQWVLPMSRYTTVTAKVPVSLKKRLSEFGVNVSSLIRQSLEKEAERLERERLRTLLDEAGSILRKIPRDEITGAIREGRDSH